MRWSYENGYRNPVEYYKSSMQSSMTYVEKKENKLIRWFLVNLYSSSKYLRIEYLQILCSNIKNFPCYISYKLMIRWLFSKDKLIYIECFSF